MMKILLLGSALMIGLGTSSYAVKQIVVGPEDTVYGIAAREGILTQSLISSNNLTPPYGLTPGQTLIVPALNEHMAGSGETLKSIADVYGVNVDVLAQENNYLPSYTIRKGDMLVVPPRDTKSLTETFMTPPAEITSTSLEPLPLVKPALETGAAGVTPLGAGVATLGTGVVTAGPLPSDIAEELARDLGNPSAEKTSLMGNLAKKKEEAPVEDDALAKKKEEEKKKAKKEEKKKEKEKEKKEEKVEKPAEVTFVWPVEGAVIKDFTAGNHDGINIKVEEGTPVKAAASGEVIYVGNEIKNLGNLVLVKHDNGYVTAYSHLSETLVKKGDTVKQGAQLATAGSSGEVSSPQLHFEIREGKKPINPMNKLNGSNE
jgi:murein DD-endopeptidase MepM/ murein hydrolase activator NlpD